jgi:hypothetical protein
LRARKIYDPKPRQKAAKLRDFDCTAGCEASGAAVRQRAREKHARRRIAFVTDPIERHIIQPPGGLGGAIYQPDPIFMGVGEYLAVGLLDVAGSNDPIEQSAQVNPLVGPDQALDLIFEPLAKLVPGCVVEPVWIAPPRQHRQIVDRPERACRRRLDLAM